MSKAPAADDFVDLVGQITTFVQNERIAAYNSAVDDMLAQVRDWMREEGIAVSCQNDLAELLDQVATWFTAVGGPHTSHS